ncbi:LacI family DNA-binding transcriptional regulator [Bifidobacterium callitrichos]|uniref:LacI family transcriptional regulator n=1 Tax=Bifidobacterium callitrichos DSM 23973 TaxID=1437609 RepID=A0A087A6S9_9BIFI|nr:LacI family DNA-binding transcriptional regulator [Bifidobacterium callitrichos]KFI54479.1 LacI family transcriptional regulator [Bifidobacterium callitrichos DSM 23973]
MANRASKSQASIVEVATLADVSTATVSRVLSGRRTKDDEIAARVRKAAAELNYSVNYAASALRSDVTNTIGLVIPTASDNFSAGLLDALEPIVDDDSRQLLLGIGADEATQIDRIDALCSRKVDGLIAVTSAGADLSRVFDKYADTIPIVQVGGRQRSFRTNMVSIDENTAMEAIIRHLAEQGVHSVAYLAGKEVSFESAELFAMFHTQVRAAGLTTDSDWNRFGDRTVSRGFDCTIRLFGERGHPDAVVCADDTIAFGVMMALHALGMNVPEDIKVVGYNDSPIASASLPTMTSVRPPYAQIVSESLRLIESGPGHPAHVSLPPQLVVRVSSTRR